MAEHYYNDGSVSDLYYPHKMLHRVDGPAVIHNDGYMAWYMNGRRHRIDGPAVVYPDGCEIWVINGIFLGECEFDLHPLRQKYLFGQELERILNEGQ